MVIRFSAYLQLSGSVPRARNKQSGVFRCGACEGEGMGQTQYMGCHLAGKATLTTIYGLRRPLHTGGDKEDPEPPETGSARQKKRK